MAKVTFGGRSLLRAAKKFENDVMEKVSDIVYETARFIQSEAIAMAPVDDGSLRDSIEVKMMGKYTAKITVGVAYAVYVEYGTGIYAENGNGRQTPWSYYSVKLGRWVTTEGMRAQPFWFDAVERGKDYFYEELRRLGL